VTDPIAPAGSPAAASAARTTAKSIRGSSVLFAGRVLALLIGLGTQVLLVRGLTKADYGAFAYALAIATSARVVISFGEDQALTRFLAIYDERREYGKLFGTYVLAATKIAATSTALIAGLYLLQDHLGAVAPDERTVAVLLVLVFLAPVDAIDRLLEGSFAVFSRPRAIFFRKYVMEPGVRLAAVAVVVVLGRDALALAVGYVAGALLGMLVYALTLAGELRRSGLLARRNDQPLVLPIREYFGFSLPLVSTELVTLSLNSVTVVLLARAGGAGEVADFRAILPAARVNQLVIFTFTMLFVPMAARFFANEDLEGMEDAYWQTAAWLALFSFPVFAVTGPLARPVTELLFGSRYAGSWPYLALLALGYYANAALGFNALTLQTFRRLRWVLVVNLLSAVLNVGLALLLIPHLGAMGAAVSILATLVLQNLGNQWGLGRTLGIRAIDPTYLPLYASVVVAAAALTVVQVGIEPPLPVGLILAALATVGLFALHRRRLRLADTFPELAALPVIGKVLR